MGAKYDYPLESIISRFSEDQLKMIFSNLDAIELTDGCSLGCRMCGAGAKKGVRSMMTFKQIEHLVDEFGEFMKSATPFLYFATDPLDWVDGDKNYSDAHRMFEERLRYEPCLVTAVPVGKEELALELLIQDKVDRISISPMNEKRLKRLIEEKYPEINDESKRFDVVKRNGRKEVIFSDRPRNMEYGGYYWMSLIFALQKETSPGKTDVHVLSDDNGDWDERKVQKLGEEHRGNLYPLGIVESHGTLLRKDGLFNLESFDTSDEHPYGFKLTPIDPTDFRAYSRWRMTPFFRIKMPYHQYRNIPFGKGYAVAEATAEEPDFRAAGKKPFTRPDFMRPVMASDVKINPEARFFAQQMLKMCTFLDQPWVNCPDVEEARKVVKGTLAISLRMYGRGLYENPAFRDDEYLKRLKSAAMGFIEKGVISARMAKESIEFGVCADLDL
jgi:hypothetical protein